MFVWWFVCLLICLMYYKNGEMFIVVKGNVVFVDFGCVDVMLMV